MHRTSQIILIFQIISSILYKPDNVFIGNMIKKNNNLTYLYLKKAAVCDIIK